MCWFYDLWKLSLAYRHYSLCSNPRHKEDSTLQSSLLSRDNIIHGLISLFASCSYYLS